MEQIDGIKLEYAQLPVCHGCLSADRKLTSLGEFHEIYLKLCDIGSFQSSQLDLLVCWECLAVLRKVALFKEKAQKAQELLNYSFYEKLDPVQCLSTLGHKALFTIDSASSPYTLLQESHKQEIDLKNEIDQINTNRIFNFEINDPMNLLTITNKVKNKNKKVIAKKKSLKKNQTKDKKEKNYVEIAIDIENAIKEEIIEDAIDKDAIDKKEASLQDLEFCSDDDWVPEGPSSDVDMPKEDIKKETVSVEKVCFRKYKLRYKWITPNISGNTSEEIPINDQSEMNIMWEREKNSEYYNRDKPKCALCFRMFKNKELRKAHMKFHVKPTKESFCCDICQTYISKKETLNMHIKAHYKKLRCKICQFECLQQNHMRFHMMEHKKYVQCRTCKATFRDRKKFFAHDKALHKMFICDYCNKQYDSRTEFEKHIERHNTHCAKCNKTYTNRDGYLQHRKREHNKTNIPKENSYCVLCNKQYPDEYKYIRHIKYSSAHRHERKDSESKKYVKKPAQCPVCEKWYKSRYAMRNHYGFTHSGVTPYKCEPCDLYFLNSTRLVNHRLRKHENKQPEKNQLCTICGRYFSSKNILINHIRTHTGERPFHCQYCEARFAQKVALQSHVKTIHLKIKRQL